MNTREPAELDQRIEAVRGKVTELTTSVDEARQESSEEVKARIARVRSDMAARGQRPPDDAAPAGNRTQSQWQQFWADVAEKMHGIQDRLEHKRDELDVRQAEFSADAAEGDALDSLDFAWWAIEQAEAAALNAIDARAWAEEQAAVSRTS